MTVSDIPIEMLAAYARFSKVAQSELFGFWYFKEKGLPSTKNEKRAFFHDLMTGQCCQLSLKGSLDQIWQIIEQSGQGKSQMPPYSALEVALTQHTPICVTFDDLAEAQGTSLALNISARLTESMESVINKVDNRGDVVELVIDPEWGLAGAVLGDVEDDHTQNDVVLIEPPCNAEESPEESDEDYSEEDDTVFPLTNDDLKFVEYTVIDFIRALISHPGTTPRQLVGLARILYALERLPLLTPGVDVDFSIALRQGNELFEEMKYWSVQINEDSFEVSSGGSVYNEGVGSDSVSGFKLYFEAGSHGYRECNDSSYDWVDGLEELLNLGATLDFTDNSEFDCLDNDEND